MEEIKVVQGLTHTWVIGIDCERKGRFNLIARERRHKKKLPPEYGMKVYEIDLKQCNLKEE